MAASAVAPAVVLLNTVPGSPVLSASTPRLGTSLAEPSIKAAMAMAASGGDASGLSGRIDGGAGGIGINTQIHNFALASATKAATAMAATAVTRQVC